MSDTLIPSPAISSNESPAPAQPRDNMKSRPGAEQERFLESVAAEVSMPMKMREEQLQRVKKEKRRLGGYLDADGTFVPGLVCSQAWFDAVWERGQMYLPATPLRVRHLPGKKTLSCVLPGSRSAPACHGTNHHLCKRGHVVRVLPGTTRDRSGAGPPGPGRPTLFDRVHAIQISRQRTGANRVRNQKPSVRPRSELSKQICETWSLNPKMHTPLTVAMEGNDMTMCPTTTVTANRRFPLQLTLRQLAAVDLRRLDFTIGEISRILGRKPRDIKAMLQRAKDRGADISRPKSPDSRDNGRLRIIPFSQLCGRDRIRIENL